MFILITCNPRTGEIETYCDSNKDDLCQLGAVLQEVEGYKAFYMLAA